MPAAHYSKRPPIYYIEDRQMKSVIEKQAPQVFFLPKRQLSGLTFYKYGSSHPPTISPIKSLSGERDPRCPVFCHKESQEFPGFSSVLMHLIGTDSLISTHKSTDASLQYYIMSWRQRMGAGGICSPLGIRKCNKYFCEKTAENIVGGHSEQ